MKVFWTVALALAATGCAVAQDPPEPPPPPPLRGDAASLKDTMKFLQDKLAGKVNFMIYRHDSIAATDKHAKIGIEVTNVSADADSCAIAFHWRMTSEHDTRISLKQVMDTVVLPWEQIWQQKDAKAGHPEISYKLDPPISALVVKRSDGDAAELFFYAETLANRVANALQHAVQLCGGGSQEPF
jgi:hypothetical protein